MRQGLSFPYNCLMTQRKPCGFLRIAGKTSVLLSALFLFGCGGGAGKDVSLKEILTEAREMVRMSDFVEAYEILEKGVLLSDQDPTLEAELLYLLGVSAWHRVPPSAEWEAKARERLEELIERYPDSEWTAQGAYTLGRILEIRDFQGNEVDIAGAIRWYEHCIAHWPELPVAAMARFRLAAMDMNAYEDPERMARGAEMLDLWLQDHMDHELAPVAAIFLADQYDQLTVDPAKALHYYLICEELGWLNETMTGHRRWRMAEIAESLGEVDLAIQLYQKIIKENLQSARGYESQKRLEALQQQFPEKTIVIPPLYPMNLEAS